MPPWAPLFSGLDHHFLLLVIVAAVAVVLAGCCVAPAPPADPARRAFDFQRDTFAYRNETEWVYGRDPVTGRQTHQPADPPPEYSLRCFVLARTAKQFHGHAEFRPEEPVLDREAYRRRVRELVRRDPRRPAPESRRVVIPGYAGLREFSAAWPELLKTEAGGAWQSYAQRGNWRMVLPFTRASQRAEAGRLARSIERSGAAVVHVSDFPRLKINHAILAYAWRETPGGMAFDTYDPNDPAGPLEMRFDSGSSSFHLPPTAYYIGGRLDAYEVYCSFWR